MVSPNLGGLSSYGCLWFCSSGTVLLNISEVIDHPWEKCNVDWLFDSAAISASYGFIETVQVASFNNPVRRIKFTDLYDTS